MSATGQRRALASPHACWPPRLAVGACTTAGGVRPDPAAHPVGGPVAVASPSATTTPSPAPVGHRRRHDQLPAVLRAAGHRCPPPSEMPSGSYMRKIQDRGRLIAGVSADTLLLGARNPVTGQIEGFDIDMLRAVSQALFGDPNKIELKVITAAQRIPALQDGSVDIVARNMTITCDRWKEIAFSSEYYRSGQKVLVRLGETDRERRPDHRHRGPRGQEGLRAQRVDEHGQAAHLRGRRGGRAPTRTPAAWCCSSRARSTRSPVTTRCSPGWPRRTPTRRSSGAGVHRRAVRPRGQPGRTSTSCASSTACSTDMRADGRWTTSYNTWLADALGKAPAPPEPVYGRTP